MHDSIDCPEKSALEKMGSFAFAPLAETKRLLWAKHRGSLPDDAMRAYIAMIDELIPGWGRFRGGKGEEWKEEEGGKEESGRRNKATITVELLSA